MSELAATIQPLATPISIFPQYVAQNQPTTLLFKGASYWKNSYEVTFTNTSASDAATYTSGPSNTTYTNDFQSWPSDPNTQPPPSYHSAMPTAQPTLNGAATTITNPTPPPLFRIEEPALSMSSRMQVFDAATNQPLCTIRRENWSFRSRYYAETTEKGPRLFESESRASWGSKNIFTFANQSGKQEQIQLEIRTPAFRTREEIYLGGRLVALVEQEKWHMKTHYNLTVAQGLDVFVVVAITAFVDSQRRSRSAGGAAGAAGGGC